MGLDVERVYAKNIDPNKAGLRIRQSPSTGATNAPAATILQEATSGTGQALLLQSANSAVAAATVQGPGTLLELKDASGTVQFMVPQTGHTLGMFTYADHGFAGWSADPGVFGSSTPTSVTAGTIQVIKIPITQAATITTVWLQVQTAGSSLTSSQCFVFAANSAKTVLGVSADQSVAWTSGGLKPMTIGSSAITPPHMYVCWFYNGTTPPRFLANTSGTSAINANLSAANSRFATADASITTSASIPASLGTFTANGQAVWAAVS